VDEQPEPNEEAGKAAFLEYLAASEEYVRRFERFYAFTGAKINGTALQVEHDLLVIMCEVLLNHLVEHHGLDGATFNRKIAARIKQVIEVKFPTVIATR
jgi:hypothetical protein